MCYENSISDGKHGDILTLKFLETLHPYAEIAIGGSNPLEHPDPAPFLEYYREKKFIPSMTVNQVHFEENLDFIDAVERTFAINSCSMDRYPLMDTIEDMYNFLKDI